jgi:16S rRNA (guanine527-N7)-methyltransferase
LAGVVEQELAKVGVLVSKQAREKLETYLRELERWNQKVNLTGLAGVEMVRRLVVAPVWIGAQLQMSGNLVDVGSGNGCPGVPLYVSCGLKRVDLIEARARKAAFLRHIANELGQGGIVVHRVRAEDIQDPPSTVDWITLQGVDPSSKLIQTLSRLFGSTTRVVWITSREFSIPGHVVRISVPSSNTVAWVFELDQF